MIRLDKLVAHAGLGTRSQARDMIRAGQVTVDGEICRDPGRLVADQTVLANGKPVRQGHVYIMMHKPAGVVCATRDAQDTVISLLPPEFSGCFPVGRLDKDTEGLLLITDDGDFGHRVTSPKHHVSKVYRAVISGQAPDRDMIDRFAQGIELTEGLTRPARLELVGVWAQRQDCWETQVTLTEGRYHQVKRMFAACGAHVTYLRRERLGGLALDASLPPGGWRHLTESEREAALHAQ